MSKAQRDKSFLQRMDGWTNALTGLGVKSKDKRVNASIEYEKMSIDTADDIFAADGIGSKIVSSPIIESFKKGMNFTAAEVDETFEPLLKDYLESINFWPKVMQAATPGRLHGAGYLLIGTKQTGAKELNPESVPTIDYLRVIAKEDLEIEKSSIEAEKLESPYFGEPTLYKIKGTETVIHRSWLIRFDGNWLSPKKYKDNDYSHAPVLEKAFNALRNFNGAYDGTASLLQDYSQSIFKMKNLSTLIAAGKDDTVIKRLSLVDTTRSLVKAIVLDSEEDFTRNVASLAGIDTVLVKMAEALTATTEIPHTILLGEGSTGSLGGAGESESRQWYDFVESYQKNNLLPQLMYGFKVILSAKDSPLGGGYPVGFKATFPPLKVASETEKATIRKTMAEADQIYITNQVLSPDEIRKSRFGKGEYSFDIVLDPTLDADPTLGALGDTTSQGGASKTSPSEGSNDPDSAADMVNSSNGKTTTDAEDKGDILYKLPSNAKKNASKVIKMDSKSPLPGLTTRGRERLSILAKGDHVNKAFLEEIAKFKKHLGEFKADSLEDPLTLAILSRGGPESIEFAASILGAK